MTDLDERRAFIFDVLNRAQDRGHAGLKQMSAAGIYDYFLELHKYGRDESMPVILAYLFLLNNTDRPQ